MATTTTNYGFDVPTSSDLVKNGATAISTLGQDIDTFLFRPFSKNVIINSAFDIWQRGTSIANDATYTKYCADRFQINRGGLETGVTVSQQATNDSTNLPFIRYAARVQRNSGNTTTGQISFLTSLETSDSIRLAGQTITLSFYARKGSNFSQASSQLNAVISTGTGTDQSLGGGYTGQSNVLNQAATLTTTWQRFSFSGAVSASATEIGVWFYYVPSGTAGAADYFEVTGIQLEQGSQATPYSRNAGSIQQELAACQRYYQRMTADATAVYKTFSTGWGASTTAGIGYFYSPVTMRTTPTSVDYSTLQWADGANAGVTITAVAVNTSFSGNQVIAVDATVASGLTQFRPFMLRAANSATAYLGFSAEL